MLLLFVYSKNTLTGNALCSTTTATATSATLLHLAALLAKSKKSKTTHKYNGLVSCML